MHIVDCGAGNIGSLLNMLKFLNLEAVVTSDWKELSTASRIILPGVGAFDNAMFHLRSRDGLIDVLKNKALHEGIPTLGICLGMQLLLDSSEEGTSRGLGIISGVCEKFVFEDGSYNIPHMGWNHVTIRKPNPLSDGFDDMRFYFVHSYHCKVSRSEDVLFTTHHGIEFVSGISNGNVYGVQFHPEKSHKYGMKFFKNFMSV
jgi:imidazole glycerol-phosphate synthase subunit HisH